MVRRGGDEWLQYWSFYPDNPQDRGVTRTGRHEGDWELVQLGLSDGRPAKATYAQHSWAEACDWDGSRPRVFVANGSHAAYFERGRHERAWPDPNDEADGRTAGPSGVEPLGDWADWPGRWGHSRASWVPGEHSSPPSPAHQGKPWDDPAAFERSARSCGAPSPYQWTETWATPALGVAALALAGVWLVRRRTASTRPFPSGRRSRPR